MSVDSSVSSSCWPQSKVLHVKKNEQINIFQPVLKYKEKKNLKEWSNLIEWM
jgi:hypothetical protein